MRNIYKYHIYGDGMPDGDIWISAESLTEAEEIMEKYIDEHPLAIGAEIIGLKSK